MIKPTIGRVVWYWPALRARNTQPQVALVTWIHSDTMVNLAAFDANGFPEGGKGPVQLYQETPPEGELDVNRPEGEFCEWMPYQKGQAAKTEALEAKLEK